jgi:signal peptide peptidase SppA
MAITPQRSQALLTGKWAIEPKAFEQMFATVQALDLTAFVAEQQAARRRAAEEDEESAPLYQVSEDGIAHLFIEGPVTKHENSFSSMFGGAATVVKRRAVREITANPAIRDVVIEFDTPGGTVDGVDDLAADIRKMAEAKHKLGGKVIAAISDCCASAGYWLAAQCDEIWLNSTGMAGCIGVYTVLRDTSKRDEEWGYSFTLVSSGGVKGLGADGKVTQELVDDVQREIDQTHELFVGAVAAGRKSKLSVERVRELADGRVHIGVQAKDLGLVDVIGNVDDVIESLRKERSMEITLEKFNGFAAEHPEAVQPFVDKGYAKGKADAEGAAKPKPATAEELEAAFPGEDKFVLSQLKANASLDGAKIAFNGVLSDRLKASGEELKKALAAQKKAEDQLAAVCPPVPGGIGQVNMDGGVNPLVADAEARAKVAAERQSR